MKIEIQEKTVSLNWNGFKESLEMLHAIQELGMNTRSCCAVNETDTNFVVITREFNCIRLDITYNSSHIMKKYIDYDAMLAIVLGLDGIFIELI